MQGIRRKVVYVGLYELFAIVFSSTGLAAGSGSSLERAGAIAVVTAVIAVEGADPVLNKADFERDLKAAQTLDGQARTEALIKLQPAHQARNHAASPVVPPAKE